MRIGFKKGYSLAENNLFDGCYLVPRMGKPFEVNE